MKKHILISIFVTGALCPFLQSCHNEREDGSTLRNVVLTSVESLKDTETTSYPGIVEEGESVSASFMADGKIGNLLVKEGDRVQKGQLIASLDDSDYRIGVSQLEAQYNQMTKEKERMDAMFEKHNIAPNDYEKFTAGYEQLKLQLDMVRRKLDYTRLYSPANGYISSKYMSEGELVGAGTPVYNIVNDSHLIANVDLPVSVYLKKKSLNGAFGSVPGIEGKIPLKMISFTPDADNNMLYRMKLSIPPSYSRELTPGMNISVSLELADTQTSDNMIPSRSIFSQDGKTYVWVFNSNDSTIQKHRVEIEGSPIGKMSVVKGLDNNAKIVETGVKQLYEGEKVNVVNRKDFDL